jgi:hypothetical protein
MDEAKAVARRLLDDALIISSRKPYGSSIMTESGDPIE